MNRLPYDFCRCKGTGCEVANDCLRHLPLFDVGPRTPIAENLCVSYPGEKQCFIQIKPWQKNERAKAHETRR